MTEHRINIDAGLARLDQQSWLDRLEDVAEEHGYFEPLGHAHSAAFLDAGPKLIVTFENAKTVRDTNAASEPRGFDFVREDGWSHLTILSEGDTWFRDPRVYGYFDRLVDDGFFEDFDNVLFYGAHSAAYAAAAFSVAAPGATVVAARPQATIDPRVTGFDTRYLHARRLDFQTRYGYAPQMIDGGRATFVLFDPLQRLDAMHAALFQHETVHHLRCPGFGWRIDTMLDSGGMLSPILRAAMDGTLSEHRFSRIFRQRRKHMPYLRTVANRAIQSEHFQLAANMCRLAQRETEDSFFDGKLKDLAEKGFTPKPHSRQEAAE